MFTLKQKTTIEDAIEYLRLIEYDNYSINYCQRYRNDVIVDFNELVVKLPYPENGYDAPKEMENFLNFLGGLMVVIKFSEMEAPKFETSNPQYYYLKLLCPIIKKDSPTYLHKEIIKYKYLASECCYDSFDTIIRLKNINKDEFEKMYKNRKKMTYSLSFENHQATIVTDYGKIMEFHKRYGFQIEPSIYNELQTMLDEMK